jgi:hypothetical protein
MEGNHSTVPKEKVLWKEKNEEKRKTHRPSERQPSLKKPEIYQQIPTTIKVSVIIF